MLTILLSLAAVQPAHTQAAQPAALHAAPAGLERTSHRSTHLPDGGTLELLADDRDPGRIARVRHHLREEAANFARGDFHGGNAAVLAELKAGADKFDVAYADTPNGGRVRFITSDPALVRALHAWLAAHVRDASGHHR